MQSQRHSSNLQLKLLDNAKKLLENVRNRDAGSSLHLSSTMDSSSKYGIDDVKVSRSDDFVASPVKVPGGPGDYYGNQSPMSNDSLDESITSLEFYLIQERNAKLEVENEELAKEMKDIDEKLYAIEFALGIVESTSDVSSELSEDLSFSRRGKADSDSISSQSKNAVRSENSHEPRNDNGSRTPPSVTESSLSSDNEHLEPTNQCYGNQKNSMKDKERKEDIPTEQYEESDELKQLREKNELMILAIKALAKATCAQARQRQQYKKQLHATKKKISETAKGENSAEKKMSELTLGENESQASIWETKSILLQEQDKRETLSAELKRLVVALNFMKRKKEEDDEVRLKILETLECRDDNDNVSQVDTLKAKDEQLKKLEAKLKVAIKYFKAEPNTKSALASSEEIEDAEKNGFPIEAVLSNADSEISI